MSLNEFQRGVLSSLAELQSDGALYRNALFHILIRTSKIMALLDELTAEVAETKGVVASAVELIKGLRQQIIDAGTDPTKLAELVASLDTDNKALAAAVANTGGSTGGV